MATVAASKVLPRCVIQGSLSLNDVEVERRPYHRNCGCALHKVKGGSGSSCPDACPNNRKVSFPRKELCSDCLLSLSSSHASARSSLLSVASTSSFARTEDTTGSTNRPGTDNISFPARERERERGVPLTTLAGGREAAANINGSLSSMERKSPSVAILAKSPVKVVGGRVVVAASNR